MRHQTILGLVCASALTAASASAFEREWHLGAGVGGSDLSAAGLGWGPELGVYGAYGISDLFDVRLEGRYSRHPLELEGPFGEIDEWRGFVQVEAALAYKIDVLRWVPWLALGAGYFHALEDPLPEQSLHRSDALFSTMLGLDYAVTRHFGLGVTGRSALFLAGSVAYGAQLRAEYRWGF